MMLFSHSDLLPLLEGGTLETLIMVGVAAPASALTGLALGALLTACSASGITPSRSAYSALAAVTNVSRSVPFLILIVLLIPFTRFVVGTSIGTAAAIMPLIVGGIPYAARLSEAALLEVDPHLIQAVQAMGATPLQLLWKVYIREALPSLLRAFTVLAITMVNFSAMAGAVGGGGLGDVAIRYGYQRFRPDVLLYTVLILVVLVQLIQLGGNGLARHLDRR